MCRMDVTSRQLQKQTRAWLDRVQSGETTTITRHGVPVAELRPIDDRSTFISIAEFVRGVSALHSGEKDIEPLTVAEARDL